MPLIIRDASMNPLKRAEEAPLQQVLRHRPIA
jgi:hypothetical protein